MSIYNVIGHMTISVSVYVEASSPEEAQQIAEMCDAAPLCYQCSGGDAHGDTEDAEWHASELDGTPEIRQVIEVR